MSNFETWWEREGQEFLYALNTTTDDDIKLVAEIAWKNGAYCAEQAEQEPFDMNDHPPHRLCECRKCMEYFTPLPDCDAFAASGKPITEQPVSQEYQDHLVNQSFDWAAMAAKHQFMEGYRIGLAEMREKCANVCEELGKANRDAFAQYDCAAAIRDVNFEGDTGFRPVSEMVAEHKQDPKKAAAIEKAKMRKAEQEPVAWTYTRKGIYDKLTELGASITKSCCNVPDKRCGADEWVLQTVQIELLLDALPALVRTKDLTDEELWEAAKTAKSNDLTDAFRAVIAAYKEKNK